jgi:hypothetical protein
MESTKITAPDPITEQTIVTRQLGSNRGKCRLWIEGKDLADAGWRRGDRFDVEYADCLILRRNPDGKRKIAGTAGRPIVDTNTDKLTTQARLGKPGDTVTISIMPDVIVVTSS